MKKLLCFGILFTLLLTLFACASSETPGLAPFSYVCEKNGFGGEFTLFLEEDGTFSYYEGAFSSYIGYGSWTLDGDILLLTEERGVNRFRVSGDRLLWIEEGSENFIYVQLENRTAFLRRETITEE